VLAAYFLNELPIEIFLVALSKKNLVAINPKMPS